MADVRWPGPGLVFPDVLGNPFAAIMSDSGVHTSQQLEHLREVLVGRPLRALEQRLERLECEAHDLDPARIREHHQALHDLYAIAEQSEQARQTLQKEVEQLLQELRSQGAELARLRRLVEPDPPLPPTP